MNSTCSVITHKTGCSASGILFFKEIKTELVFAPCMAHVLPMKLINVTELELQAFLLAAHLKREIGRGLTVTVDRVFMCTDSAVVLQWVISTKSTPSSFQNV